MESKPALGLIVNPVAGLGGRVGLKGSDGRATVERALALGAVPRAGELAARVLRRLASRLPGTPLLAGAGSMGEAAAAEAGLPCAAIGSVGATTTAADTRAVAHEMRDRGVRLLLFSGGDGTARDILSVLGEVPMLGIPAGVKMQSGVFATSPEAAGDIAALVLAEDSRATFRQAEVLDLDEDALRTGRIEPRLFGVATVPFERRLMQSPKARGLSGDGAVEAAAAEVAAGMQPGTVYLVGPGTSAKAVLRALELEGTLLGIDAVLDGKLIGSDLGEQDIVRLAGDRPIHIILGVVGGQGFLFGRGNQPITPALIARAGREAVTVLASQEKLLALSEPTLLADTGDPDVDRMLAGFIRVRTGLRREALMRLSTTSIRD
ncbi:MAG: ATP-NAD kinase family protein [Parvibaculaceae bacterium]